MGVLAASSPSLATVLDSPARVAGDSLQLPEHPAGCEVVALQNALEGFGVERTFDEVFALFDRSTWDFATSWWGDPDSVGAAYPPAVEEAANRALEGTGRTARDATGIGTDELSRELSGGAIAVVWFTTDYAAPRWSDWWCGGYRMYSNEHAITIDEIAGGNVYGSDPLRGRVAMALPAFEETWRACGGMAVLIS